MTEPAHVRYLVEWESPEQPGEAEQAVERVRSSSRDVVSDVSRALQGLDPIPTGTDPDLAIRIHDVVRIREHDGRVVFEKEFDGHRASRRLHDRISSDLLLLDVDRFRKKYAILPGPPPPRPSGDDITWDEWGQR